MNTTDTAAVIQYTDAENIIGAVWALKEEVERINIECDTKQMLHIQMSKCRASTHHKLQNQPKQARERCWGVCRRGS